MGKKKQGLSHSQSLGIVWISVVLLFIAGVVFFSSRQGRDEGQNDSTATIHRAFLTQREDSVYRSKRKTTYNKHNSNKIKQKRDIIDNSFYTTIPPAPTKQPLTVELNSADTLTLQLLHGIGPAYARRIVHYRERLGGFTSTGQLLEVYGFTPELLEHISPYLRLDTTAIRHLNINSIELKQLAKHPYVEYYQARDIVRLRSLGRHFHSADDLRAVPSMADSTLDRLLPYLDFSDSVETK